MLYYYILSKLNKIFIGELYLIDNSEGIVLYFAKTLQEKKAKDTIILDIKKISIIADYFIITTSQSSIHLKSLIAVIKDAIIENKINRNLRCEGSEYTGWALLDCGDIIIHLFSEEKRSFYHLEQLWQDAKQVNI